MLKNVDAANLLPAVNDFMHVNCTCAVCPQSWIIRAGGKKVRVQ
jgi:hypothetical protein